jgi:hypothetical protein
MVKAMALPSSNLMMVGLGSWKDAPPNSEQPPLRDAIHLRWSFKHNLGFPWFGFYLFRRLHQAGTLVWLSQDTGNLQAGKWPDKKLDTPQGQLSSDTNLSLTEDFAPPKSVEFDLDGRRFLKFTYLAPARRVEARVGFRARPGDPPPSRNTVTFTGRSPGEGPNPRTEQGVVFEARDQNNQPRPRTFIRAVQTDSGRITGLGCKFKLDITLPTAATFVEVTVMGAGRRDQPGVTPTIEAFNQDGSRAGIALMQDPASRQPETMILGGTAITRVVIDEQHPQSEQDAGDDQNRVVLTEISYGQAAVSTVSFTAFAESTPVGTISMRGYAGRIVSAAIEFDGISSIDLSPAPAALIDLGSVPLVQDATAGWERLSDFTYPMRLCITHPDYPCTPGMSENFAAARELAKTRIQYGHPQQFISASTRIPSSGTVSVTNGSPIVVGVGTNWSNDLVDTVLQVGDDPTVYTIVTVVSPTKLVLSRNYTGTTRNGAVHTISRDTFGQLYNYLASLVTGGSAAGSMADRTLPMPVATAGTITVNKDSASVQGNGTTWTDSLAGLDFQLNGDPTIYTITRVDSPTQLTLDRDYPNETATGKTYRIGARLIGSGSGAIVPRMPVQSPLDMVLLGTLHPAVAQMVGLYWADRTPERDQRYDYLIVADYTGVGGRNPDQVLALIKQSGFSTIDGYIVHNLRMSTLPRLASPDQLQVYALPGSSRLTESGTPELAINNAGLRWNLNKTDLGVLLPGQPVMYHLWRAELGNAATPSAPSRYNLISRDRPILVVKNGATPQARDWPPFPLHAMDNALADGWYSYQVSGVDIFGRHTPNSTAASWRQWTPMPEPRPWYYQDPPSEAVIHPSAILLLTKIAPPIPSGVEAYAIDPADPIVLKDAAYSDWWTKLNNSKWYRDLSEQQRKNLIGLRVRWLWPQSHMLQAPHTREFRIYYQPGHLNALLGNTQTVAIAATGESDVTTDIPNATPANSYVGATLYAGEDAFVVVDSQAGTPLRLRVKNVGPGADIMPPANAPCTVATPAAYSKGTVSVVNGSNLVTGDGTHWPTTLAGMLFQIATDERSYRVAAFNSETQLVLEQPYAGVTRDDRVHSIRHPLFVDYSLPRSWQRRYYVVDLDKNWTAGTDAVGQPVRQYEVFLPPLQDAIHEGLPLSASLTEPIVYAHVGISAADDKSHTADDPKWTGTWAGRVGNEGRVGPPAKIFRVLREPPPPPSLPRFQERAFATRADANGTSFYTYRWQPLERTKTHVFRALDNTLFEVDWLQRPRPSLVATQLEFFPNETIDPRWTSAKRQQIANELNQLNTFAHDASGTAQAFAHYRGLSADALRVLAGLKGNEAAFTPATVAPLDPDDPSHANRRGPDDADDFQIGDTENPLASPSLRIFIDTLDGRTSNRYFYRAAYVDAVQNQSALSLATPPVEAPNVVPPRAPVIAKVTAGDREVTIRWMSNREPTIARYHVYQTDDPDHARTVRLMTLVHTQVATADPELVWTNSPVPAAKDFFYRLVAEDGDNNLSEASPHVVARAFDDARPEPPAWGAPTETPDGLLLNFTPAHPSHRSLIQRRDVESLTQAWANLSPWLAAGTHQWNDNTREEGRTYVYRIRVLDQSGKINNNFNELTA